MILSLILMLALSLGGAGLTYLFAAKATLLWRMAAGCVVGSAVFGTAAFVLASLFGFNTFTVLVALVLAMLPVVLLKKGTSAGQAFRQEWGLARNRVGTWNAAAGMRFLYYALFFLLFLFFFDRAMMVSDGAILTGGSNNLGDLPFHLGAIASFVDGNNFPPMNPSFAGTKFSYPFIADLVSACFMMLGISIRDAMHAQNLMWAFSLVVIFERFVFGLVGDRLAAKLAPVLLMLSGGLGFAWFFSDWWGQATGFFQFLGQMPKDYTIGDEFRWGNSLTTLFITQRGMLLGMPLTLLVLGALWEMFRREDGPAETARTFGAFLGAHRGMVVIGLLAGLLVMVHLHSLMVLFIVSLFLMMLKPSAGFIKAMMVFGVSVALGAVPELIWSLTGSSSRATEFFSWHFGWDKREHSFVWFWVKNTGIAIPSIAVGIYLLIKTSRSEVEPVPDTKKKKVKVKPAAAAYHDGLKAALFYVPFVFIFVASNAAKFAPWEWDNIKLLIYWYVVSAAFIAFFLSWLWRQAVGHKIAAAVLLFSLTAAGALDVWRVTNGQINWTVFSADAVAVADRIKATTPRDALFVNATTYNSAVVLSGRPSLMRYPGHLGSHGIDYREREQDIRSIYAGGPQAKEMMRKWGVGYVMVSPEEKNSMNPNEEFFTQYPITAQAGEYRVYRITE